MLGSLEWKEPTNQHLQEHAGCALGNLFRGERGVGYLPFLASDEALELIRVQEDASTPSTALERDAAERAKLEARLIAAGAGFGCSNRCDPEI